MIGSPDLLAFTTETDFLEQSTECVELPTDLSVPLYPRSQYALPWSRGFNKDFILISEFSEQVGPQPLLTIPEDAKTCGSFDLNHFSLRIMSVDYQTTLTAPANFTHAKLNFVEDSKVVLGDSGDGAYAYVHHLTLYDPEARGFVRPFCMAYVAFEEEKIMHCFKQLSQDFSKASECLKTGNRKNFAIEVDKKLSDLEYTRLMLLREINRDRLNDGNGTETTSAATKEQEQTDNRNRDSPLTTKQEELKEIQSCRVSFMEADRNNSVTAINQKRNEPECEFRSVRNNHDEKNKSAKDQVFEQQNETKEDQSTSGQSITWARKADELAHVEKTIQDYRSLLKQITSYPNRKLRDPQFLPYEPDDAFHSLESELDPGVLLYSNSPGSVGDCNNYSHAPSHTPQLVSLSACRQFDKRLKRLDELCDEYFLQQALAQLRSIERCLRGDSSYVLSRKQTQNLLSHLKSTNFLFEDLCDHEKETGQQLSALQPRSPPPLPVSPLQSEPVSLDSYVSCVEMVPIRLEQHRNGPDSVPTSPSDDRTSAPNYLNQSDSACDGVSLPMKDSVSSGESIEVLGTENSIQTRAPNVTMETVLQRPAALLAPVFEGRKARVVARRENSEDSIEVLSVTDSIIPDDLRASCPSAIYEETPEHDGHDHDESTCRPGDVLVQCRDKKQDFLSAVCVSTTVTNPPDPHVSLDLERCPYASCSSLSESDFLHNKPFTWTPDDFSDCTSYRSLASTGSTPSSLDLRGGNHSTGSRRKRARLGRAALNFIRQFPLALHAVYSLLIGRTVVVLGSEERAVRRSVAALTVYTPHLKRCTGNIMPWTSSPLQITDLLTWKLIGFNRSASPSSPSMPHCLLRFSRYLSVLDLDQKTLRCPPYKGSLICPLVEARNLTMRGTGYFLYAQSIISQLVARAFLLTFSHEHQHSGNRNAAVRRDQVFAEFHNDDLNVLRYLSELITQNATGTSAAVLRFSYTASTLFKI